MYQRLNFTMLSLLFLSTFFSFSTFPQINQNSSLLIEYAHDFEWIYDDHNTGAEMDLSIWRINRSKIPQGFYPLGDIAVGRRGRAPQSAIIVKEVNGDQILKRPLGYQKIWNDSGSGGTHDVTFFRPIPPQGYECLGDVAMRSHSETPSTDLIRCVRNDFVTPGTPHKVWDDAKSGAKKDGSVWVASSLANSSGLRTNAMITGNNHSGPVSNRVYLLKIDHISNINLQNKSSYQDHSWNYSARMTAPGIFLHSNEQFFPSSVEHHLQNTTEKNNFLMADIKYDLDTSLPFLHGFDPSYNQAPIYTFIGPKNSSDGHQYVDMIFFMFYPYNLGKYVDPILWDKTWYGNHVGDWEHLTVRYKDGHPSQVFLSQHGWGELFEWGHEDLYWQLNTRDQNGKMGIHPIVFSALGSHAVYSTIGSHLYRDITVARISVVKLIDETNVGKYWLTWNKIETIYYNQDMTYDGKLSWMNYKGRWGNPERSCIKEIGVCRLEDGPEGIPSKSYIYPHKFPLD